MSKIERGRQIKIDSKEGLVIETSDGTRIELPPLLPLSKKREGLSQKATDAIQALEPIKRRALFPTESLVDQDSYFSGLDERLPRRYENIGDPMEIYRSACATLGRLGYSSDEVAGFMLEVDSNMKTGRQIGDITTEGYDMARGRLANEIRQFYPRNFPKRSIGPRK